LVVFTPRGMRSSLTNPCPSLARDSRNGLIEPWRLPFPTSSPPKPTLFFKVLVSWIPNDLGVDTPPVVRRVIDARLTPAATSLSFFSLKPYHTWGGPLPLHLKEFIPRPAGLIALLFYVFHGRIDVGHTLFAYEPSE